MEGWPVQASDAELRAAAELARKLTAQGFVVLSDSDLCVDNEPIARIDAWSARQALVANSIDSVRYEPTGEEPVADVTQVSGEVWVPEWIIPLCAAAVQFGGLKPDPGTPNRAGGPRDMTAAELRVWQRGNLAAFGTYVGQALCTGKLRSVRTRAAMLAVWRMSQSAAAIHDMLFPRGYP